MGFFNRKKEFDELFRKVVKINSEQEREIQRLRDYKKMLDALAELSTNGMQVIGVEEKEGCYFAAAIRKVNSKDHVESSYISDIYFFRLPETHIVRCLGRMSTEIQNGCTIHLTDWNVKEVNQGFGSIFMKMVIDHYRNAGFQFIIGNTSFVDKDHMDLLLHFYLKFGFSVTETDERFVKHLHLDLREPPRTPQK